MYRFIVYYAGKILGVLLIVFIPHAHQTNVYDSLQFEIDRVLSMRTWTRVRGGVEHSLLVFQPRFKRSREKSLRYPTLMKTSQE